MHRLLSAIFLLSVLQPITPASAQERVRLSPSAVLDVRRDPIEDTEFSSVTVRSTDGTSSLKWACYGRFTTVSVSWAAEYLPVRSVVWRFGPGRPDTLALDTGPPPRTYGEGFAHIVFNRPVALANFPDSVRRTFTASARGGGRLVVRLIRDQGWIDLFFDLSAVSRGLDRLSCLRAEPPRRPALLGRESGAAEESPTTDPVPLDSAAVAELLQRVTPADQATMVLREVLVTARIDASGGVDSVQVFGAVDPAVRRKMEDLARAIRFRPAERDGQPVPGEVLFYIVLGRRPDYY